MPLLVDRLTSAHTETNAHKRARTLELSIRRQALGPASGLFPWLDTQRCKVLTYTLADLQLPDLGWNSRMIPNSYRTSMPCVKGGSAFCHKSKLMLMEDRIALQQAMGYAINRDLPTLKDSNAVV